MDLVALRAVQVGYHRRRILPPVDLTIRRGTFLGIVGPNGSGKTTIARTLLGLIRPVAGRVEYPHGRKPRFGYVPQRAESDRVFPVTALDLVVMGRCRIRGLGRPLARADREAGLEALRRAGLAGLAMRPLQTLSGGQRQRALIARALVTEPEVLVLDEPTTGMDIVAERSLLDLVLDLHERDRLGVVVISHHLSLVASVAHEVMLVDKERQRIEHGPVDAVVTGERLSALYGVRVAVNQSGDGQRHVHIDTRSPGAPPRSGHDHPGEEGSS